MSPKTITDETRKTQLLEKLQQSVLVSLDRNEVGRLSASSKIVVYAKGDFIIQEGSYDDRVFCLIAGEVDVRKSKDVSVAVLHQPGEIFGEMGVIDGGARSASVRALKDNTICLSIDAGMLDDTAQGKTGKGRFLDKIFTHLLAQRLRTTTDELSAIKRELEEAQKELVHCHKEMKGAAALQQELAIHQRTLGAIQKQLEGAKRDLGR